MPNLKNLYTINIKDHGKDVIDSIAKHFTEEEIKKNFPDRVKCFVAVDGCEFYKKLGYDYYKGIETPNEDGEFILSKSFN